MFDRLVFEFDVPVNVAGSSTGLKIPSRRREGRRRERRERGRDRARGLHGKITVVPDAVTIYGRAGSPSNLLDEFLEFLRKFSGLGEPKALKG